MAHDLDNPPRSPRTTTTSQSLHAHRQNHNPSKLPAFRFGDLKKRLHLGVSIPSLLSPDSPPAVEGAQTQTQTSPAPHATLKKQGTTSPTRDDCPNTTTCTPIASSSPPKIPSSSPDRSANPLPSTTSYLPPSLSQPVPSGSVVQRVQDKRSRRAPASHSSNGIETFTGPPPALSTQRSFAADSARHPTSPTTEWALAQQELAFQSIESAGTATTTALSDDKQSTSKPRNQRVISKSLDETALSRPRISPIRSFRSSATRATLEMTAKGPFRFVGASDDQENDRDATLRALQGGFSDEEMHEQRRQMDEQERRRRLVAEPSSEDLFLNLARDDQNGEASTGTRRRSRIALASHRQSLPPTSSTFQLSGMSPMPRRGSDLQRTSPPSAEPPTYGRDRTSVTSPTSQAGLSRSRYASAATQSTPTTPKTLTGRETTFQSALSYGGRRASITDSNGSTPQRLPGYRQSNLSYGGSRVYNSSPLVGRTIEVDDGPETPRAAEGTESTTSTTAPSTVWDELDDLKSRIRKLELTGKLPSTSGAAVSHATGDRPPTATTTITTMSTSPKRGRGLSASPIDPADAGPPTGEVHPLLHSALAKSKSLLSSEVYKALEATASDALAIAAMMGTAGQPGPISSSQSTIGGGNSGAADRQLRRKADSMCRSLTELCLALSEEPKVQPTSQALVRSVSRERDYQQESPRTTDSLSRMKSAASPRALSRLESRRSTLLGNNSLPSPRFVPSSPKDGLSTPSQPNFSARRTSLLIRNRRAGTEELDEDETRFRAPSRATTEIGRLRNSPREYTSREEPPPLPDNRPGSVQSSLPVRRHYASTSLNSGQAAGQMRYLDRSTPERSTTSVVNKLAEDRGQRAGSLEPKSSVLGRVGSLGRQRLVPRGSEVQSSESSTIGTVGGYQ